MKRKKIRTRGEFPFSKYFQELKEGSRIAVVEERALNSNFPKEFREGREKLLRRKAERLLPT